MSDARSRILLVAAGVALLAIGVVLGSGPLRAALLGDVGTQIDALHDQVDQRARERDAAEDAAREAIAYVDGVAPALLAGRLAGAGVLVVTAAGADGDAVRAVEQRIVQSGGEVTGQAELGTAWATADTVTFREALAEQVASTLVGVSGGDASEVLAHAFVQGATGGAAPSETDLADVDAAGADRGPVLWSLLVQADLAAGEAADRADAVVVIAGDDAAGTAALIDAFAQYDAPVVVIGTPTQVAPHATSGDVSTVAADEWTVASVTVAATMAEGLAGGVAHYSGGDVPEVLGALAVPSGTGG